MEYQNPMSRNIADAENQYWHTGVNRVNAAGSFQNAQNPVFYGNPHIITSNRDVNLTNNNIISEEGILMKLANAACLEAGHEIVEEVDRPKCHEDTRKAVIDDIMSWVDSEEPHEKIMWLKGPAGAGKSSIAQSICMRCREEGKLLSSFFFSRATGGGRADGTKLIATMAYQITQEVPETKRYLVEELSKNPAILSYTAKAMQLQLQKLVLQPLSQAIDDIYARDGGNSSVPYLLVIDGLDECHNIQLQSKIIALFASALVPLQVKVKCFIISRPELVIRNAFSQDDVSQLTTEIVLDNKYKPDEDIRTYLTSEFSAIKRSHTLSSRLRKVLNWPANEDVGTLVLRASGQFIYAVTVMRYVKDERRNPITRLQEILCIKPGQASQYEELDALYTHILNNAVENALEGYANILPVFQIVLHCSKAWGNQLSSICNMALFLDVPEDEILINVVDLHSIMFIPNDYDKLVDIIHASFIDYLNDEHRSRRFYVKEKTAHKVLAHYSLVHAVENESQDVKSGDNGPVSYSRRSYLDHLAMSDFDDELLEELKNRDNLQSLIDQFIMQYWVLHHHFNYLNVFYNWESFEEYDKSVPRPQFKRIKLEICECVSKAIDDCIISDLCAYEYSHWHYLGLLKDDVPTEFSERWTRVVLLNPVKSRQFYFGNKRCQHIWRRLWKLFQEYENDPLDYMGLDDVPTMFEYLLERIELCLEFKTFLRDFLDKIETWFFDVLESDSQNTLALDKWTSLKCSISTFIEKCENLMLSNTLTQIDTSNYPFSMEEMEDTPLNVGVKSPWIIIEDKLTDIGTIKYNPALPYDRERSFDVKH